MRLAGKVWSPALAATLAASGLVLGALTALAGGLPASKLEVRGEGGRWVTWWSAERAPTSWRAAEPSVARAVTWHVAAAGIDWGELLIGGTGEAWRLTIVLARIDTARVRLELVEASREGGTLADWSLADLPAAAVLGLNAGQFSGGQPWGWLVRRGKVVQPPATGPLSMAFCVGSDGGVRFLPVEEIPAFGTSSVVEAFQSYPVLLRGDGEIPEPLMASGLGLDVAHRDARLAIGQLRDGRILIALTRFAAGGDALGSLPFGPTVPEMAALLGALGCLQAVMLDGGISAQLAFRDAAGRLRTWRGWRKVPLALVAYPR
ncbi:MAG: phosphodiester glycosidase family protein [Thermoanaerobaculia bacterium]